MSPVKHDRRWLTVTPPDFENLNTFSRKKYDSPPRRKRLSRFRRHILKTAGMTVALANYNILRNKSSDGIWRCFVTYGIGSGYRVQRVRFTQLPRIRRIVEAASSRASAFSEQLHNGFSKSIPPADVLQGLYESDHRGSALLSPVELLHKARTLVFRYARPKEHVELESGLLFRNSVPKRHLLALLAVCHIAHAAEQRRGIA